MPTFATPILLKKTRCWYHLTFIHTYLSKLWVSLEYHTVGPCRRHSWWRHRETYIWPVEWRLISGWAFAQFLRLIRVLAAHMKKPHAWGVPRRNAKIRAFFLGWSVPILTLPCKSECRAVQVFWTSYLSCFYLHVHIYGDHLRLRGPEYPLDRNLIFILIVHTCTESSFTVIVLSISFDTLGKLCRPRSDCSQSTLSAIWTNHC